MRHRRGASVDLIEIYHARQTRDRILAELQRLADGEAHDSGSARRRRRVRRYYEAMLITVAELLGTLGDDAPLG
jgi:hypothetical protein